MTDKKEGRKERISPEEWEQQQQRFLERKLKLAQRDDMGIVSRRTLDSTDFIRLFGTTDFMLSLVRPNMGRKGKIELSKAARFLAEAERIKEELNLLNAEMCRELGREYKPPYGFVNPLKEEFEEHEPGFTQQ
ncbi:MAG: hypothetical protein HXX11_12775 [Desulfuromonadales bacterium]|nr:hypothetical protein [Desulfuromonadales bacterium]